jgi:hypothetical protein
MLQTTMHALHPDAPSSGEARFVRMKKFPQEEEEAEVVEMLKRGIEDMVIEGRLRREGEGVGPMRTVLEKALEGARSASAELRRASKGMAGFGGKGARTEALEVEWDVREDEGVERRAPETSLPSPVSRSVSRDEGIIAPRNILGMFARSTEAEKASGAGRARSRSC